MLDKSKNPQYKSYVINHFNNESLNQKKQNYFNRNQYLDGPYDYIKRKYFKYLKGKKVLHCCYGTGATSILISSRGADTIGTDISKDSIDYAKKRAMKLKKCKFFVMDTHKMSFNNETFDIIYCYNSLLYLNLKVAFEELNRVLKPNGKIIIIENLSNNFIFKYYRVIKHYFKNKKFLKELNNINFKDIEFINEKFYILDKKFFDFSSILGKFLYDKFKVKINPETSKKFDNYILNKINLSNLSYTVCLILKKK